MLKERLERKGLSDMSPKRQFQRKWKINECKRQRAWRGGGEGAWKGVGRVPGRQLTVEPFGPLTAAASIFLFVSPGWHGSQAESLATDTIDHAIFSCALCRGLYYHSDQLNHQPFPPPPSQTNPPQTFLPKISSARGRPAGRSGNIAYCRMYSWQTRHKQ